MEIGLGDAFESPDLEEAVGVISGKWKVRIICLPFSKTKRFGQLRSLAGAHRGTLTYVASPDK